jgi:putative peptidoglycan lipid II flippase
VSGSVVNAALIIIAAPRFGIDAVAIGNLANAVFQITLLLWLCFARDREPAPTPCLSRRANFVLVTAIPLVVSGLLIRITPVIDRYLASEFDEGTIARLAYAFRLVTIAPGVFTAGVGAVLFPRMSLSVAREQLADLQRTVAVGLGLLFTFCVPTVLIGGILAPDIVRILFERGAFTPADTAAVAQAIRLYLPSLLAIVLSVVTARALYALNRVRLVAVVGAIESVVYIAYTYALMRVLGWQGIAVGFSAYCLISLAWQLAYLRHRLGPIVTEGMGMVFGRAVSAGVSATLIVWAITRALDSPWMKVALGTVAGIACFTIALRITRSPELRIIVGLLPRFRTKSTPVAESIEP